MQESWGPLAADKLAEITERFGRIFPTAEYGDLAQRAAEAWIDVLREVWRRKAPAIRARDERCRPEDPLSRIQQRTLVIAYADSVRRSDEAPLSALDAFLKRYFPAVRGVHMLPSCAVVEGRFNDGYFSQVVRNRVHEGFGTDGQFSELMERRFSMTDFVLNHVDVENPRFQAYLQGDEEAGRCFFVFTEGEYQEHLARGDFARVYRPRPFPLFTIFRRRPRDPACAAMSLGGRLQEMQRRLAPGAGGEAVPLPVLGVLYLFSKIRNDQMLPEEDHRLILEFREYLSTGRGVDPDTLFAVSETQEVRHVPYVFRPGIGSRGDLLRAIGMDPGLAARCEAQDEAVFGPEIRALTTFSHVQVDLNTGTFEGLMMLARDFAWYLSMDINLLRLDAANYAFKKWGTRCYGLPEVTELMNILYRSMEAVSPRMVPNLEVNDKLGAILAQMADRQAPPPMMYDFHLPCVVPLVFNTGTTAVLPRVFAMIGAYDVSDTSIRFSLAESHDGKSIRGSMDLLTLSERQTLAEVVEANGGRIKYKSVPPGQIELGELNEVCREAGIDAAAARTALFEPPSGDILRLRQGLDDAPAILAALGLGERQAGHKALAFFFDKVLHGREPYELCCATRDCLVRLEDPELEASRYLAFYTLAFALMGRNVKSVYFNDLLGLPNDHDRLARSGELRDLKRTKSDYDLLAALIADTGSFEHRVAAGMNDLIALVDSDPALHCRGNEAEALSPRQESIPGGSALVHCSCAEDHSLVVVNVRSDRKSLSVVPASAGLGGERTLYDNIARRPVSAGQDGTLALPLEPFQRMWLSRRRIPIDGSLLVSPGAGPGRPAPP